MLDGIWFVRMGEDYTFNVADSIRFVKNVVKISIIREYLLACLEHFQCGVSVAGYRSAAPKKCGVK